MYLTSTRPDLMYVVSLISRFMEEPKETHWNVGKMILRYVNGTTSYGILYAASNEFKLDGFIDSDWAGNVDDRKSISGYAFNMGSSAISWASKKQPIISLSTIEVEYIVVNAATCQAIWLRRILADLHQQQVDSTIIHCDNVSSISLIKNQIFH